MHFLWSQCQFVFEQHGGIVMTMFFVGISGGLSHCAGMCGPFVITQVARNMDSVGVNKISMFTRLKGASLLPYHMGRLTTYSLIGMISAFLMSNLIEYNFFKWISFSLLASAAVIIFLSIFSRSNLWGSKYSLSISATKNIKFDFLKKLFKNPVGLKGYLLGVILGFIPCGLIYSVIMVVSATGSVAVAAISMIVFSVSTIPGLLLVGLGASFAPVNMPIIGKYLVPFFMVLSFFTLIYVAGGLLK